MVRVTHPHYLYVRPILMRTGKERESILRSITPNKQSVIENIKVILEILKVEMDERRKQSDDSNEYYENIYMIAFLLYLTESDNYIELLWELKNLDFDLGCGLDCQYLVGGGVQRTLGICKDKKLNDIADYIQKNVDLGEFNNLEDWKQNKIAYFY